MMRAQPHHCQAAPGATRSATVFVRRTRDEAEYYRALRRVSNEPDLGLFIGLPADPRVGCWRPESGPGMRISSTARRARMSGPRPAALRPRDTRTPRGCPRLRVWPGEAGSR